MEALREVSQVGVGLGAEAGDKWRCDEGLLALKDADLERGVLWSVEDLVGE
jgi:hypothetical protein